MGCGLYVHWSMEDQYSTYFLPLVKGNSHPRLIGSPLLKKYTFKKAHIITVNLCKQTNETLTSIILALLAPSQHKKPTKPWAHDCMEKMKHIHPPYMVDNWFWILHHMWGCPWVKLKGFLDLTHPNGLKKTLGL